MSRRPKRRWPFGRKRGPSNPYARTKPEALCRSVWGRPPGRAPPRPRDDGLEQSGVTLGGSTPRRSRSVRFGLGLGPVVGGAESFEVRFVVIVAASNVIDLSRALAASRRLPQSIGSGSRRAPGSRSQSDGRRDRRSDPVQMGVDTGATSGRRGCGAREGGAGPRGTGWGFRSRGGSVVPRPPGLGSRGGGGVSAGRQGANLEDRRGPREGKKAPRTPKRPGGRE